MTTLSFVLSDVSIAQYSTKSLEATRIEKAPVIDGVLDELFWKDIKPAEGFIMDKPSPGVAQTQQTEVKIAYDHEAMFVAFICYDTAPDSILSQLSGRDVSGNSDYCGITFSCYRDGINGVTFNVSPKGEQYDARIDAIGEDVTWNAVWYCKTKISEIGWIAEFKIPFAAVRFPQTPDQVWNINFVREVRRCRQHAFWNGVNPLVPGFLTQMGMLTGIRNIQPPRRIFFYPYTSSYYNTSENKQGKVIGGFSYNFGLDTKIGLSDAFTLDATIIPDFGQTLSDQQILNLSAFEVQFTENRQFFIEGTELFSKGGIFYSRRIGFDRPLRYDDASKKRKVNEVLVENPNSDQILNAIKISGRDKNKLGIGFFNSVTAPSAATVRDTITGEARSINTSSLTNYNVFVLDQILPNNSYVSLINTSVVRGGGDYDVNVVGTDFELRNKGKSYSIAGSGALNTKYGPEFAGVDVKNDNGFRESVTAAKINGKWRYKVGQYIETDTYDPNDLGFLQANNEISYWTSGSYSIFQPFGRFNNFNSNLLINYYELYKPNNFTQFQVHADGSITTRKFHSWGYDFTTAPVRGYDYFEPRVWGRYFRTYTYARLGFWFSSDYRKKVALDVSVYYADYENPGRYVFNWRIAPRFRLSDHLFITHVYSYQSHINDVGFAYNFEDDARLMPLFASRNVISHTNVLNIKYAFNPIMTINARFRHYWGYTDFRQFKSLQEDGYLIDSDNTSKNQSFNSFTIDLVYSWIFKPGSELRFVWKNAINQFASEIPSSLSRDMNYTFAQPQNNSYSIKLIYFLDYHSLTDKVRRQTQEARS